MSKKIFLFLACLCLSQVAAATDHVFDDEDDGTGHHQYKAPPGSQWKEADVTLPAYPDEDALVAVSTGVSDYPFTVLVDLDSLSVGPDRVVRYTVVLRSRQGAENISYEGILCNRGKVKRYAYGIENGFQRLPSSDWRFIRRNRQDLYRKVLADRYFCPLPSGDMVGVISDRLKARGHDQQILWDRE